MEDKKFTRAIRIVRFVLIAMSILVAAVLPCSIQISEVAQYAVLDMSTRVNQGVPVIVIMIFAIGIKLIILDNIIEIFNRAYYNSFLTSETVKNFKRAGILIALQYTLIHLLTFEINVSFINLFIGIIIYMLAIVIESSDKLDQDAVQPLDRRKLVKTNRRMAYLPAIGISVGLIIVFISSYSYTPRYISTDEVCDYIDDGIVDISEGEDKEVITLSSEYAKQTDKTDADVICVEELSKKDYSKLADMSADTVELKGGFTDASKLIEYVNQVKGIKKVILRDFCEFSEGNCTCSNADIRHINDSMKLESLIIDNSVIMNVDKITGCTSLKELEYDSCVREYEEDIKDEYRNTDSDIISLASSCPNLEKLRLNMEDESVDYTPIGANTKLSELVVERIGISYGDEDKSHTIEVIGKLTNLKTLQLSYMNPTSTDFITGLTELEYLKLTEDGLTKCPSLSRCTKLKYLDLGYNDIETSDGFSMCDSIETLILCNNHCFEKLDISRLKNLKRFDMGYHFTEKSQSCDIGDDGVIARERFFGAELQEQKESDIEGSPLNSDRNSSISSFEVFSENKELEYIDVCGCEIKSIDGVEALSNLRYLNISNNPITDISGITYDNHKKLNNLAMRHTCVDEKHKLETFFDNDDIDLRLHVDADESPFYEYQAGLHARKAENIVKIFGLDYSALYANWGD